jgi:hypothetical protein
MSEERCKDQVPDAEQKQHLERKARCEKTEQANGKRPILEYRSVDEQRTIPPVIPQDRYVRSPEQQGRAADKHPKQSWARVVEVNQWSDEPEKEYNRHTTDDVVDGSENQRSLHITSLTKLNRVMWPEYLRNTPVVPSNPPK